MQKKLLPEAEQYAKRNTRRRIWQKFVRVMACIVVFCTTYSLILPAITMERDPRCGLEEHTHTEDCYTQKTAEQVKKLACTYESLGVHEHEEQECYDEEGTLICGYADFLVHKHDASCVDESGSLVCQLPEIEEHEHTEAECYRAAETESVAGAAGEAHVHGDSCYTVERGALTCQITETEGHTHTDACYIQGNLQCQQEETEDHSHTSECYEQVLNCGQGEVEAHKHTDECYEKIRTLTCQLTEGATEELSTQTAEPELKLVCEKEVIKLHSHTTEECYETYLDEAGAEQTKLICEETVVLEHTHSDSCYETEEIPVDTETLTCGLQESEGHTHEAGCYDENGELICTEQAEAHQHTAMCYGTWELTCTQQEHTHSLACDSDSTADVETEETWKASFADATLTGIWAEDLVAIAQTQLGYTESTANYTVLEDGETMKGYTRYGTWYGEPYGDWSAMFVSFCLNYAGVENMPLSADCSSWTTELAGLYRAAEGHVPQSGELVFFDRDADAAADHVGLVAQVLSAGEEAAVQITVIEGDSGDMVQSVTYDQTDVSILGYAVLPERSTNFQLTAETESGIVVTISGEGSSLPYPASEITVTAVEVVDEAIHAIRDQMLEAEGVEAEEHYLLDITLWHDDEEIEPTGPVTVTFGGLDTEGYYPHVYHIDTETQEATNMEAAKDTVGDVVVTTDHFSVYDVMLTATPSGTAISGEITTALVSGKTVYLNGASWASDTINIDANTTLDLNGYGLYYSGSGQCIVVRNNATLTIKDSAAVPPTKSSASGNKYGQAASITRGSDSKTPTQLTYYVTESTANGTGTTEELFQYNQTVKGFIIGEHTNGASAIVRVESGSTFNLEGGMLTILESGVNIAGDNHIVDNSGTFNLKGGFVCGNSDKCYGGGVYSGSGSTVTMSGGVVAANYGNCGGGIAVDGGTFTMSNGVISGNGTHGDNVVTGTWTTGLGGGVYAKNATFTLSGGYITNNSEYGKCEQNGYGCHGGGGIATNGGTFKMTSGYVTGNYSAEAGGGMYVGHSNLGGTGFTLSGGTIASNYAAQSEGGGIRISGGTNGVINAGTGAKVYITNNQTHSTYDWGGGGIFVQQDGNLNILNSLITSNSADGYGGGVGACPTGETLIVHTDGAAIYDNTAKGQNMSGGGNGKNYDREVALNSDTFTSNGYQDYFCVKDSSNSSYISLVTGEMVGGGAANWTGSCDNQKITISKTGHVAAKYLFGLTAAPDADAIADAQKVAGVIITGNSAYTHGGGIMTNGGLILGKTDTVVTAAPALEIKGTKALTVDGTSVNSGRDFTFQLKNSNGDIVGTATSNTNTGEFTISPNVEYEEGGTYTYYLTEYNDSKTGVVYDDAKYKIDVTIGENSVTLLGVTFKSYYVKSVEVSKLGEESSSGGSSNTTSNTFKIHYQNTNNWDTVSLHIWYENNDTNGGLGDETSWPGYTVSADPNHSGWNTKEFTVSGTGSFHYIFSNNGSNQTSNLSGTYASGTELWVYANGSSTTTAPDGWSSGSSGTTITSNVDVTGTANSDESYTLTFNQAAFTNTKTTLSSLQITKLSTETTENGNPPINNVTFTLTKKDGTASATKLTDANGIVTFTELERGATYTLTETAPTAYVPAGPWEVVVDANGTITINGLTVEQSNNNTFLYTTTIYNSPWGFELPQTGGTGTYVYTMAGLMLMLCSAAYLLYRYQKRRREGF